MLCIVSSWILLRVTESDLFTDDVDKYFSLVIMYVEVMLTHFTKVRHQ